MADISRIAKEAEVQVGEFFRELFYSPKTLKRPGRVMDQYKEAELFNPHARPDAPATVGGAMGSSGRHLVDMFLREPLRIAGRLQDKISPPPPGETEASSVSLPTDLALEGLGYLPMGKALAVLPLAGMIKGVKKSAAAKTRKLIQIEKIRRVRAKAGKPVDFMRDLLEGVWWHGRATPPKVGKTLKGTRIRKGEFLGEPTGISLSKDPAVAYKFARFAPTESGEAKLEITRSFPLFRGVDPKDIILDIGSTEGHKIYKEAYEQTIKDFLIDVKDNIPDSVIDANVVTDYASFKTLSKKLKAYEFSPIEKFDRHFNEFLTEELKDQGYKGNLWNPRRGGGEYELRIFDPEDVVSIDKRDLSDIKDYYVNEEITSLLDDLGEEAYSISTKGREFVEEGVAKWDKVYGSKVRKTWKETSTEGTQSISEMLIDEVDFAKIFDEVIPGFGAQNLRDLNIAKDMLKLSKPKKKGSFSWKDL